MQTLAVYIVSLSFAATVAFAVADEVSIRMLHMAALISGG